MLCAAIIDVNCENPISTQFMKDTWGDEQRIVTAQLHLFKRYHQYEQVTFIYILVMMIRLIMSS
jgi:hypothetical protein